MWSDSLQNVFTSIHLANTHFKVEKVREAAGQTTRSFDDFSSWRGRQRGFSP